MAWYDVSVPKSEGGLGIRNLEVWSDACALKLIWMLFFRTGSIWVAWMRSKYLSHAPFWSLNEKNYGYSWMFRRLLKLRSKALHFLKIHVGNGDSTFFWWDPWTPFGMLYTFFGHDGPSRLGVPLFATVADVRNGAGWSLTSARSDKQLQLLAFVSTLALNDASDVPHWYVNGRLQKAFVSKSVWNVIRPHKPLVSWSTLVWHKAAIPRHATTAWLFVLNRNPTLDRLQSWNPDNLTTCLLCGSGLESRNHLFFDCASSVVVWLLITRRLNLHTAPYSWNATLTWLPTAHSDRYVRVALLQGWQAAIYGIWFERNTRFHTGLTHSPDVVARNSLRIVIDKCYAMCSLGSALGSLLLQIWHPP